MHVWGCRGWGEASWSFEDTGMRIRWEEYFITNLLKWFLWLSMDFLMHSFVWFHEFRSWVKMTFEVLVYIWAHLLVSPKSACGTSAYTIFWEKWGFFSALLCRGGILELVTQYHTLDNLLRKVYFDAWFWAKVEWRQLELAFVLTENGVEARCP